METADAARRYPSPSPTSTNPSAAQSPAKQLSDPIEVRTKASEDGPPPAKKRRTAAPKDRSARYLDLTKSDAEFTKEDAQQMDRLMVALRKKKKIVVIAGAGISVSAGIPDFRSSNGLFATARTQHKVKGSGKHLFDASVYKHDSSTQSFHNMVREMARMSKDARPTPFHHMLASLAQEGRLLRLYSQNIDCLDVRMKPLETNVPLNPKGPWPATVQLHGGLEKMVCTKCGQLDDFRGEVFDGPEAPLCQACVEQDQVRTAYAGKRSHGVGRLRPRFVLYNEYNPDEEAIGNVSSADLKSRPDAVIVVGTTLKVPGTRRLVKELCQVTRGRRDGFTAWINIEGEPKGVDFKDCWDLVVRSKCDDVARLVTLPPWDCNIGDDYLVSSEEDRETQERLRKITIAVDLPLATRPNTDTINPKPQVFKDVQEVIPTPRPSPTISGVKPVLGKKQSKLPFAKQAGTSSTNAKKQGKGRAGKPSQANKAAPKRTVTDTFKVQKSALSGASIKLDSADKLGGLPPLRPEGPSLPILSFTVESPDSMAAKTIEVALDSPTPSVKTQDSDSAAIISPVSKPKGMGTLIE